MRWESDQHRLNASIKCIDSIKVKILFWISGLLDPCGGRGRGATFKYKYLQPRSRSCILKGMKGKYSMEILALWGFTLHSVLFPAQYYEVCPLTSSRYLGQRRVLPPSAMKQAASFVTRAHCAETAIEKWGGEGWARYSEYVPTLYAKGYPLFNVAPLIFLHLRIKFTP